jgi:hypothetical protein
MANSAAICTSFKVELMLGAHQLGTVTLTSRTSLTNPTTDTLKGALYLASASLGAATTVYSAGAGEVSDASYTAGGVVVTNANPPTSTTTIGWWNPSASLVWNALTLATAFDTLLLYNFTQNLRAIAVFTFGSQTINNGTLTLSMPASDSTHALIQLA